MDDGTWESKGEQMDKGVVGWDEGITLHPRGGACGHVAKSGMAAAKRGGAYQSDAAEGLPCAGSVSFAPERLPGRREEGE